MRLPLIPGWRFSARQGVTESAGFAGHFAEDIGDDVETFVNFFSGNIDCGQKSNDGALSRVDEKSLLHTFADGWR